MVNQMEKHLKGESDERNLHDCSMMEIIREKKPHDPSVTSSKDTNMGKDMEYVVSMVAETPDLGAMVKVSSTNKYEQNKNYDLNVSQDHMMESYFSYLI